MIMKDHSAERVSLQDALRDASGWKDLKEQMPAFVERVEGLLATVNDESMPGAILPRLVDQRMVYYAVADELPAWRSLQGLLSAFVGRTLTDFTGIRAELNQNDPFEALLLAQGVKYISRFESYDNQKRAAAKALSQMQQILAAGARTHRQVPLSTVRVLYNFKMALSGGDAAGADEAIEYLRAHLRLDALNLHFLQVQRLAAFQEWERLYRSPAFAALCDTRRPPQVTGTMVEALYRSEFTDLDEAGDLEGALGHFREVIEPKYGNLFLSCPRNPSPAVAKLFLIATLAAGQPDSHLAASIAAVAPSFSATEAPFAEQLLAHPLLATQQQVPQLGDYRSQLLHAADPKMAATVERGRVVLFAAMQDGSLDAYDLALTYVERLNDPERERLLAVPTFRHMWQDISRFAGAKGVPQNWLEWAEQLPELRFTEAQRLAQQAVTEWPIAVHLQTPQAVDSLIDALNQALNMAEDHLSHALPDLVNWIRQDERWPYPSYRALYMAVLDHLLYTNRRGEVLGALLPVLEGCLTLGMDSATYGRILSDLRDLTKEVASVRQIDWLLGLGEYTIDFPCPDQQARAELWCQISSALTQFSRRLQPHQISTALDIAQTLGLPESVAELKLPEAKEGADDELTPGISGTAVIYTLTESVGQRARRVLNALYPGLRVEVLSDHVATPRLLQFARSAELFVICWTSAKHAATTAIQAKRPPDRVTAFAAGGGSASIVNEVQKHLTPAVSRSA